jgi:hypothetical protein
MIEVLPDLPLLVFYLCVVPAREGLWTTLELSEQFVQLSVVIVHQIP